MIDVESIKELFIQYGIKYTEKPVSNFEQDMPESLLRWSEMMGTPIRFDVSAYGVAKLHLLSQDELFDEYVAPENAVIRQNNCQVIASGPNGDLICVDMTDGKLVFVFHDELWEADGEDFSDISIKLDMDLKEYLEKVLSGAEYPADGYDAEEYKEGAG